MSRKASATPEAIRRTDILGILDTHVGGGHAIKEHESLSDCDSLQWLHVRLSLEQLLTRRGIASVDTDSLIQSHYNDMAGSFANALTREINDTIQQTEKV